MTCKKHIYIPARWDKKTDYIQSGTVNFPDKKYLLLTAVICSICLKLKNLNKK